MITVAIKNNAEKNVIQMTYEDLWRELKDIPGAELIVVDDWFDALPTKNGFVCFVEADCLVSGGFFASQVGIFKKDKSLRRTAVLATATGVLNWANRIYGYRFGDNYSDGIIPQRALQSSSIQPIQIAFIPGAIMRTKMLEKALGLYSKQDDHDEDPDLPPVDNLVEFSALLSVLFWSLGDSHLVAINPNTTYVTTEGYPADIAKPEIDAADIQIKFTKAGIA